MSIMPTEYCSSCGRLLHPLDMGKCFVCHVRLNGSCAVMCDHANETPRGNPCKCPMWCYCKVKGMCKSKPSVPNNEHCKEAGEKQELTLEEAKKKIRKLEDEIHNTRIIHKEYCKQLEQMEKQMRELRMISVDRPGRIR